MFKIFSRKFGRLKFYFTFAIPNNGKQEVLFKKSNAKVAQLVEHNLAKVGVARSNRVFRSKNKSPDHNYWFGFFVCENKLISRIFTVQFE